jgi:phosphopantetheine adenylyltransferase
MHNLKRVNNEPHLRKDPINGAVVNVSSDEYYKYLKRKETIQDQNARMENLESELSEVKSLLREALEKLKND